ncbi:hypothetical protein MHYP_G00090240 [Metynnis hypsauchen]
MDRLKRKYILPGCDETEIPARTKRWKKRKALIETNNLEIHQSFQDLPSAHDSPEVWSPLSDLSQSLSGTAEEVDRIAGDLSEAGTSLGGQHCLSGEDVFNLMDYGDSDHDVENFSEDAHDAQHTTRLHDNCSDSTPRDRASPLFFEDESSTECDPHFNDLPNLSQSESSSNLNPDNLDDSVSMSVFEPRQSFTDSDSESILASGEQFSLAYEDSTDESVYEGEFSYEKFPQYEGSLTPVGINWWSPCSDMLWGKPLEKHRRWRCAEQYSFKKVEKKTIEFVLSETLNMMTQG